MDVSSQQNWLTSEEEGSRDASSPIVPPVPFVPFTANRLLSPYNLKTDCHSSHSVILSYLRDGRGQRLLDVGAAQGDLAELLTQRGYDVTAIEGDPGLAAMAEGKCREVVVANLETLLPHLHGPFDVVLCADVLEHLRNPLGTLIAVTRLLKPNGTVIVSVPNTAHLWVRLQLCFGRFEYTERGILDATHVRLFTLASFLRLLREAGLEMLELTTTPAPLPLIIPERYHGRVLDAVHAINATLARVWKTLLAYQFVAVARRRVSP